MWAKKKDTFFKLLIMIYILDMKFTEMRAFSFLVHCPPILSIFYFVILFHRKRTTHFALAGLTEIKFRKPFSRNSGFGKGQLISVSVRWQAP